MAYSKQIKLSRREKSEFLASLMDKKIDLPGVEEALPEVKDKIREMEEKLAKKHGFVK